MLKVYLDLCCLKRPFDDQRVERHRREAVAVSEAVNRRARVLVGRGFPVLDAFHVAYAEAAKADFLATCDDRLLRLAKGERLRVRVANPLDIPLERGA